MRDEQRVFWDGVRDLHQLALPPHVRAALARSWGESAQAEHASIASFNRFSLQLLAVGAPPELLEAAQEAALDEIHHSRMCFALASQFAAQAVGPAALDLSGEVLGVFDLAGVAAATVEEGCVGETLAALEAEAARDAALHPVLCAAWSIIAADEARHAELAFSFVRWALCQGDARVSAAVEATFESALLKVERAPKLESIADASLEAHGYLSAGSKHELRLRAVSDTLRPALAALL